MAKITKGKKGPQGQVCYFKNFNVAVANSYEVLDKYNGNYKVVKVKVPSDCTLHQVNANTPGKTSGVDLPLNNDDFRVMDLIADFKQANTRGAIQVVDAYFRVSPALYSKLQEYNLIVK